MPEIVLTEADQALFNQRYVGAEDPLYEAVFERAMFIIASQSAVAVWNEIYRQVDAKSSGEEYTDDLANVILKYLQMARWWNTSGVEPKEVKDNTYIEKGLREMVVATPDETPFKLTPQKMWSGGPNADRDRFINDFLMGESQEFSVPAFDLAELGIKGKRYVVMTEDKFEAICRDLVSRERKNFDGWTPPCTATTSKTKSTRKPSTLKKL